MAEDFVSGKSEKAFDEQTLAKVLEAAYVLQEHNRAAQERETTKSAKVVATAAAAAGPAASRAVEPVPATSTVPGGITAGPRSQPAVRPDYSVVLGQIVETQRKIQAEHLEPEYAMLEIAERATQIAQADGAGIGFREGGKVRYRAAAGAMALPIDTEVAMEKALSTACLRIGQVVRCNDVNNEFLVDVEECRRRGIQSMIAAPVHHSGNVVGALELYYGSTEAFSESDVHTCQLMAGLVAESMARSDETTLKRSVETERAAMRDALEKLKPNLEALAQPPGMESAPASQLSAPNADAGPAACRKCGHDLVPDEQFCGECGWPCGTDYQSSNTQSKIASLWKTRHPESNASANGNNAGVPGPVISEEEASEFLRKELPELFNLSPSEMEGALMPQESAAPTVMKKEDSLSAGKGVTSEEGEEKTPLVGEVVALAPTADWTSAAAARQFLERVAKTERRTTVGKFLRARRGDIYLAVAVVLISIVIRWGIWSTDPAHATANSAAAAHRKPGADLPLYDRILINLGLAEAPPTPEYKGNPNTVVWVDVQTALYYCPGSDLYGKTSKGHMATQHDAQLDQFEPASRKPCD